MDGQQRPPFGGLTEDEIEALVDRLTKHVVENFYKEVGRNVVQKFLWLAGVVTVGIATYLGLTGKMGGP